MKPVVLLFSLVVLVQATVFSQGHAIRAMDFRNQNITDILMVLAETGRQSVIVDETVTGTATFHFSDSTFEEALFQLPSLGNQQLRIDLLGKARLCLGMLRMFGNTRRSLLPCRLKTQR